LISLQHSLVQATHPTTGERDTTFTALRGSITVDSIDYLQSIVVEMVVDTVHFNVVRTFVIELKKENNIHYFKILDRWAPLATAIEVPFFYPINWQEWKKTNFLRCYGKLKTNHRSNQIIHIK
jgi:hypothetical protein